MNGNQYFCPSFHTGNTSKYPSGIRFHRTELKRKKKHSRNYRVKFLAKNEVVNPLSSLLGFLDLSWFVSPTPLLPDILIGGRLKYFTNHWETITSVWWVLDTTRKGLTLKFKGLLQLFPVIIPVSFPRNNQKCKLEKGAIQPFSPSEPGFLSICCSKEKQKSKTIHWFESTEPLPSCHTLPDGNCTTNKVTTPSIAEQVLRFIPSPINTHKSAMSTSCPSSPSRNSYSPISRWLDKSVQSHQIS